MMGSNLISCVRSFLCASLLPKVRIIQELDAWQTKMRVKQYPTLLEFLGYAYVSLCTTETTD